MGTIVKEYCVYVLSNPRKPCSEDAYPGWGLPEAPFYVGQGLILRPWQHLL